MAKVSCLLVLLVAVVAAISGICVFLVEFDDYVFDPAVLQKLSKEAIAETRDSDDIDGLVDTLLAKLHSEYGEHILAKPEWMFNNAGGAMGSMLVLHCSVSEYIIIFGTPLGTEGHTGRFPLTDDYFTILHGEQWAFSPGELTKSVYKPGDQHHLRAGEAKQYKMHTGCWALEYARGNIPSMLPFGFTDTLFSTLDLVSLWQTVRISAIGMFTELAKGKI
eukprot:m.84373 g.84373  ORF g.84373 m.84373 type:complete len:220 (-) comp12154_c2_seq5:3344-4003(-)